MCAFCCQALPWLLSSIQGWSFSRFMLCWLFTLGDVQSEEQQQLHFHWLKGTLLGRSGYTAKCYKETCRNILSLYGTPCMVFNLRRATVLCKQMALPPAINSAFATNHCFIAYSNCPCNYIGITSFPSISYRKALIFTWDVNISSKCCT